MLWIMISWVRIRLKLYIYIIFLFSRILIKSSFCHFFAYFPYFYLFKINTMHVHLTLYIKYWRSKIILQTYHFNTQSFYLAWRFSFISTLKKMFPNGGLNPNQSDRSHTPIPLRYLTGQELNRYEQYLLMTKGTPLLYNKVKFTKINGLFMKVGQCKVK